MKNKEITLNGGGLQKRSFIYIEDVTDVLVKFVNSKVKGIFNIGNPVNHISIKELAEIIVKLTESSSEIKVLPPIAHDVLDRVPNIEKVKLKFNWEPKVSLEEGLTNVIKSYVILKN